MAEKQEEKKPKAKKSKEPKATDAKMEQSEDTRGLLGELRSEFNLFKEEMVTRYQELFHRMNGLTEELNKQIDKGKELRAELESVKTGGKNRGPASTREMNERDAWRVRFGDLKDMQIKEAAKVLGLSYGQVYSAKGEYTFKGLSEKPKPEWVKKEGT